MAKCLQWEGVVGKKEAEDLVDQFESGDVEMARVVLQVTYERGLLNTEHAKMYKVTKYTPTPKEDFTAAQRTDYETYNLRHILGRCCDFVDKLSQIGHTQDQIGGAGVDFTPVCHAELTGRGDRVRLG